jgi:hypothetical protein
MVDSREPPESMCSRDELLVRRPRLSIAHLLLWTASSALMFALYRKMLPPEGAEGIGAGVYRVLLTGQLAYGMLMGTAITGSLVVLRDAYHRSSHRPQPGEWLMLATSVQALAAAVTWRLVEAYGALQTAGVGMLLSAAIWLFAALTYAAAGVATKEAPVWRRSIYVIATVFLIRAATVAPLAVGFLTEGTFALDVLFFRFSFAYTVVQFAAPVVRLIALVAAARSDWRRRVRRGWLHNVGVTVLMLSWAIELLQSIAFRLVT